MTGSGRRRLHASREGARQYKLAAIAKQQIETAKPFHFLSFDAIRGNFEHDNKRQINK
jgi:hypothetical protein